MCVGVRVPSISTVDRNKRERKKWGGAGLTAQRSLQSILATYPITVLSAQFDLLCLQPEPFPRSLTASISGFPF